MNLLNRASNIEVFSLQLKLKLTDLLNHIKHSIFVVVSVTECQRTLRVHLDNFPVPEDAHRVAQRL